MKKIILAAFAALAIGTVTAQENEMPGKRKHPGMKRHPQHMMAEKIKLSEEQKQKAKTLHEDFRKNMMELRKKDDITVKEWKTRMADLQKKQMENMQGLLSKEQKDQVEKMKTERKKMAEIDAHARMEKMKLHLNMSNDQAEKMKKHQGEMMEKMKALHENKTMDMMKKREEMKLLMEKRKESMKSILTEEQMKKMHEMKRTGPPHKKRKVIS